MSESAPAVDSPARAVTYAESLGVHTVWEEAVDLLETYEACRTSVADERRKLRSLTALHDEEVERAGRDALDDYLEMMRSPQPPKDSQAARERHVKDFVAADDEVKKAFVDVRTQRDVLETLEAQEDVLRRKLDLRAARLTELGGLLTFYAIRTQPK